MASMRWLVTLGLLLAAPVAALADCPADSAAVPAAQRKALREFQAQVQSGPFYRELAGKTGTAEACTLSRDGDNIRLSYTFGDQGRLAATVNPAIEFAEQKAAMKSLTGERALALLHEAEKHAFGSDGCGIEWKEPEKAEGSTPGSSEVVYRGDACNCQAREVYEGSRIIALVLRSAC